MAAPLDLMIELNTLRSITLYYHKVVQNKL
jgi:hypothetical protein